MVQVLISILFIFVTPGGAKASCACYAYKKTDGKIFYRKGRMAKVPADFKTFKSIPLQYGRPQEVTDLFKDPFIDQEKSFEDRTGSCSSVCDLIQYGKDKNSLYFESHKLEGSDPKDYEFIHNGLVKSNGKYYCGKYLMDAKTFKVLNYMGAKDAKVFCRRGRVRENMDAKTLKMIPNSQYAVDKNAVYYQFNKVDGVSPKSFKLVNLGNTKVNNGMATNGKSMIFRGLVIENSDPKTFKRVGKTKGPYRFYPYWKDKNYVYTSYLGREFRVLKGADPRTFRIDGYYAKDKKKVYFDANPVLGADVKTFRSVKRSNKSRVTGKDKTGFYIDNKYIGKDPENPDYSKAR